MNQLQECPVCTLYLRPGISLKTHLDTHPKDQVIDALLRAKEDRGDAETPAGGPGTPLLQPQMTTAVTYQQILTTNSSGAVVPQFLQVPALVNSSYGVSQNMGFAPTLFNPMYNPYIPQPYSFGTAPVNTTQAQDITEEEPTMVPNEEVGSEMDLSDGSPVGPSAPSSPSPPSPPPPPPPRIPAASVIIARSHHSRPAPSPPPLQRSPSGVSSPPSPVFSTSCASPTSFPPPPPLVCKAEDSVIVEPSSNQKPSRQREDVKIDVCKTERKVASESEQHSCHRSDTNATSFNDHEIIAHLTRFQAKLPSDEVDSFVPHPELKDNGDGILVCQISTDELHELSLSRNEMKDTSEEDLGFSYSDDAANFDEPGSSGVVYADLVPSSSPRLLHDLLPATSSRLLQDLMPTASSSNAFMELDGIRIFFNGSSALAEASRVPSPPSVIQMADSTKADMSPMPLNITADESMPARGELSEQESLGADSAWGLFQQDVKMDVWPPPSSPPIDGKPFRCSDCHVSFADAKERRAHKLQMHTKPGKVFKCVACGAVFSTLRDRRSHMAVHAAIKTLKEEGDRPSRTAVLTAPGEVSSTAKHCHTCAGSFPSLRELRVHLRETHGEIRFKCDECETCFDEEVEFNLHLKVHPLKCTECAKLFYRRANLSLHMKRHLPVKPFECSLCPKSFITRQKLEEHTNGHTGVRPIKCVQCDKTFSRHSNLIQHRNLHHPKTKRKTRDYVCRCGEVFHSQRKLEWHREIHDNKPKSCPFCAQKFIHSASVTRHVRRSHFPEYLPDVSGREYENVSCPICDRVYLRSSLSVHMRVHNGERPFQCNVCSKQFTTKWNMELHQWTHQSRSAMPYKCTQCKSAFFREADHLAHLNAHRNLKPFICNVCGQKFIRKYNCLRHQEEHKRAKRFTCPISNCGRAFHRSYYLKDHMKVHTGLRPHTCHICGKASSTKSNHNKHVRIHDTRELVNTEN